ncbi:MAG: methyltransferase domain-containing protein, partial [Candidatus Limisoma sp.]|nr:methyltransferase domain-containing protein [Candidatus Limisoma sp.]
MNLDFIDSKEFNAFLEQYSSSDPIKLRLKKFSGLTFDLDFAITQISCRQKARRKLPELGERLIYPTAVSIEQCTSEAVARLHGTLFADCRNVYDLTCGLGIDAYYIAQNARRVACCDINPEVAATARHNFNRLGASNIEVECRDAVDASLNLNGYDACFVDPSRRGETASMRLYSFADCTPNLKTIVDNIRSAVKFIIVKGSPMVDIAQTINEYPETTDIWVVSVKND